ncbi:MAG: T9SS type A sorting domain-containing protein [candidate division WOR-3 bacterium]
MKIFRVTFFVMILLLVANLYSQSLPAKTYGAQNSERCYALLNSSGDNGYLLAGWTKSFGPGTPNFSNVLIVKTDSFGSVQGAKISIGEYDDEAYSMVQTMDGGFAVTGWTKSYGIGTPNFSNIFVLKFDSLGNLQWSRVYGGLDDDQTYSIIQTLDLGYAIVGWTKSFGPPPYPNSLVMKLDPMGFIQWAKVYWAFPNHIEDESYDIVEIPSDTFRYAVVGRAKITTPNNFDAYTMLLDLNGNPGPVMVIPGVNEDEAYSVVWDNTGIVTSGWTNSFGLGIPTHSNIFVWKVIPPVAFQWGWVYGWQEDDEKSLDDQSLLFTQDGGYAIAGWTKSFGPGIPNPNFLILKLTPAGLLQWARVHPSMPGAQFDEAYPIIHTYFGGYGIAGWTNSFGVGMDDFHFLTLDPLGNRPACVLVAELPFDSIPAIPWEMESYDFQPELDSIPIIDTIVEETDICPVVDIKSIPSGIRINKNAIRIKGNRIEFSLKKESKISLQIFDIAGCNVRTLVRGYFSAGNHYLTLPSNIEPGIYFIYFEIEGGTRLTNKFIKL